MNKVKHQGVLSDREVQGLDRMRELNEEFLAINKCSNEVRQFLEMAGSDIGLMLVYLKARKYRPDWAWETLRRKVEVRFDQYPEVFLPKPAKFYEEIEQAGVWGLLKNKDSYGRRIICVRGCKWDPNVYTLTDLTNAFVQLTEKLLLDDDAVENGVILIGDAARMGLYYARYFGLHAMIRIINVLWFACPLKIKGVFIVNVPFYLIFIYKLTKPFFPKKLKERFSLTTPTKKFVELHASIDKKILPEYLGGFLEYRDAFEYLKF